MVTEIPPENDKLRETTEMYVRLFYNLIFCENCQMKIFKKPHRNMQLIITFTSLYRKDMLRKYQ